MPASLAFSFFGVKLVERSLQRMLFQFTAVLRQHFVGALLSHSQGVCGRLFTGIDRFNRLGGYDLDFLAAVCRRELLDRVFELVAAVDACGTSAA